MIKMHGKEYPYCYLKACIPDVSFDQLSEITKFLGLPNNAHSLVVIINIFYNDLNRQRELAAKAQNESKGTTEQVGNEGPGSSYGDNEEEAP